MNTWRLPIAVLALLPLATETAQADEPSKWFVVEKVSVNPQQSFMLRVDVDKPDRVYREGEKMTVRIKAEKDCYLHLLYYSGDRVSCLFPNKFQQSNFVRANTPVQVPASDDDFTITCRPPFGDEVLQVIATLEPQDLVPGKDFKVEAATPLDQDDLEGIVDQYQRDKKRGWAEARIRVTTMPADDNAGKRKRSRHFAVCVGISEYQDDKISALRVSHRDAQQVANALKERCNVDDVTLLTNSEATAEAIERAIFHDLVQKSKPGDTVILFFSNHGGRCADVNGDEKDGLDEYIVPHDGILGKPETMILDDQFARWVQELDGRKIALIFDLCYSGGAAKNLNGESHRPKSVERGAPKGVEPDFIDEELKRAKDLGQKDTMLVAACEANQLAWEMPEENGGSVLTHYFLKAIETPEADRNRDGSLSLAETYAYLKAPVEEYVLSTFQARQNPVLIDNANDSIAIKP